MNKHLANCIERYPVLAVCAEDMTKTKNFLLDLNKKIKTLKGGYSMKRAFIKALCTLLLFIFIFGFTACKRKDETPHYDESRHLEIIKDNTYFDDEYLTNANLRFTKIADSLIKEYTSYSIDNNKLSNLFNSTLLPILYRVNIYPEQLDEIFSLLEDHINSEETTNKPIFLSVYEICLYVLGSDKSGHLAYEISLAALNNKINTYNSRLESSGISFYKTWAMRCSALYSDLEEMGKAKFTDAISLSTTVFSTLFAATETINENAFLLSDEELLFILDKQGDALIEKNLSEDDWQTFGGLISELVPNKQANLNEKVIYALKNYTHTDVYDESLPSSLYKNSYFATAMKAMPKVIELFADVSKKLNEKGDFSLEGTAEEKQNSLIYALQECEGSIIELDIALKTYLSFDPDYLKDTVTSNSNPEELESFIGSHSPKTCEDFISELRKISSSDAISDAKFKELLISYVYSYSPYLAFAVSLNFR